MATKDPLKDVFRRKVSELAERAAVPAKDDIDELERLSKLIAWRGGPPAWRRRLPPALAVAGALCVLSFLFFNHRQRTELELVVSAGEVEFALARDQRIHLGGALASLRVTGAEGVRLPRSADASVPRNLTGDPTLDLRLAVTAPSSDAAEPPGALRLDSIALTAGHRVRLRTVPELASIELSVADQPTHLGGTVRGPIRLAVTGSPGAVHDFGFAGGFEAWGPGLSIALGPARGGESFVLARNLEIEHLDLHSVEKYEAGERTWARRVSAVRSGSVYLEELGGQEVSLRPGDRLRWTRIDGWIREIAIADGAIRFALHGEVEGLQSGPESSPRRLMPTQLAWLKSSAHSWTLLWGSVVSLAGIFLTVIRWWRA